MAPQSAWSPTTLATPITPNAPCISSMAASSRNPWNPPDPARHVVAACSYRVSYVRRISLQGVRASAPEDSAPFLSFRETKLVPQHQTARNHVVQRLFLLRESRHDVPDPQRNQSANHLREISSGSPAK